MKRPDQDHPPKPYWRRRGAETVRVPKTYRQFTRSAS